MPEYSLSPDSRRMLLMRLMPDDIFHASAPNGASFICIVINKNENTIYSRRVTTQENFHFDINTGDSKSGENESVASIDSVEPLPIDIYNVFIDLDRRYRLSSKLDRAKLCDAEKRALAFVSEFYKENKI